MSKKVHKSAVKRNRIRRRIYEIIRLNQKDIDQPHDFLITIFSEEIENLSPQELSKLITKQLRKAGIINPSAAPKARAIVEAKD